MQGLAEGMGTDAEEALRGLKSVERGMGRCVGLDVESQDATVDGRRWDVGVVVVAESGLAGAVEDDAIAWIRRISLFLVRYSKC